MVIFEENVIYRMDELIDSLIRIGMNEETAIDYGENLFDEVAQVIDGIATYQLSRNHSFYFGCYIYPSKKGFTFPYRKDGDTNIVLDMVRSESVRTGVNKTTIKESQLRQIIMEVIKKIIA